MVAGQDWPAQEPIAYIAHRGTLQTLVAYGDGHSETVSGKPERPVGGDWMAIDCDHRCGTSWVLPIGVVQAGSYDDGFLGTHELDITLVGRTGSLPFFPSSARIVLQQLAAANPLMLIEEDS